MSFFQPQNPGIDGIDELTDFEQDVVQTISSLGTPGQYLATNGAANGVEWVSVSGGGHTIEDEGTPLTQRTKLNFVGAGVTVTDDSGDDATVVTIPGGSGSGDMLASVYDPANIAQQLVGTTATQTLTNKTFTAPRFADNGFIADQNGNEMVAFNSNASAVNFLEIENSVAGSAVHMRARGDDTNVGLHLVAKGATGYVNVTDAVDETKRIRFDISPNATATTTTLRSNSTVARTIDLPNATGTLALTSDLTNKVDGPASATDNAVARFDTTTGKLIQNSSVTISDTGSITVGNATGNQGVTINSGSTRVATITQEGSAVNSPLRISSNGSLQLEVDNVAVMTIAELGAVTFAQSVTLPTLTTTGNIELGNASDTTISRVSAGVIAVEGVTVSLNGHTHTSANITDFNEAAQDAVGAMVATSIVYNDTSATLQRAALTGAITASQDSNTTSLGSFTKAQLDTAVSDGNVLYVGDVTTNATHTGEVTGSGALTVDKTAITNKTLVTAASTDTILIADASDTDNLKKVTVQSIVDLAGGSGNTFNNIYIDQSGGTSDTYGVLGGTINGSNAVFTVSEAVYATGTLKVWLNGQLMTQGTGEDFIETTPASGTFTFNTAPASGSLITVEYQKVVTNSDTIVTTTTINELAQDAIGAMVDSTLVYTDGTPLLSRAGLTGAITASAGSNSTSLGSFTKAQLDTAVSDGNVMYIGDAPTAHTHLLAAGATDVTITAANLNILDDGVDTTLHFHASDRNRANHTGTQAASTISDFSEAVDDRVSALIVAGTNVTTSYNDVANTLTINATGGGGSYTNEEAQDAVGTILVDSSEIDFTYNDTTPSITASIVAGSIDEAKLDTSVNASLDLADSALQAANISDVAYDATTWNGSTTIAPSRNAVRDRFESLQLRTEIFVAASDATAREIARADYLCDGTADQVEINNAIDVVRTTGGKVVLSSGNFAIAASISMIGETAEGDGNSHISLHGSGIEATYLNGASNINVIATGQRAKYDIGFVTLRPIGSGDGISQTAGTERGNWQSHVHDIYIVTDFSTHTGWGIDMQSPFRMRFTNIEMNGVANGARLQCHTNSFNPGNISIDRMFIDLWDNASNANAIGLELSVQSTTATNVMNLVSVNRLDIAGGTNLTNSIGVSIVGATSSFGDSRHHSFRNLNIEDVQIVLRFRRGRDCTFHDINYTRVLSGGTFIDLDSGSHNNHFENAYVVAQGSGQTFNLITDSNGSSNLPNSLTRVDGFQPSTVTINATLASNTILERVDLSGGSPTIDADITNRNDGSPYLTGPGNNKVYGTNGSGVKVWKDDPVGGGGVTRGLVTAISTNLILQ